MQDSSACSCVEEYRSIKESIMGKLFIVKENFTTSGYQGRKFNKSTVYVVDDTHLFTQGMETTKRISVVMKQFKSDHGGTVSLGEFKTYFEPTTEEPVFSKKEIELALLKQASDLLEEYNPCDYCNGLCKNDRAIIKKIRSSTNESVVNGIKGMTDLEVLNSEYNDFSLSPGCCHKRIYRDGVGSRIKCKFLGEHGCTTTSALCKLFLCEKVKSNNFELATKLETIADSLRSLNVYNSNVYKSGFDKE